MKNKMIRNAKSYNKHLTDDFLNKLNNVQLLSFVHPRDRSTFFDKLTEDEKAIYEKLENDLNEKKRLLCGTAI